MNKLPWFRLIHLAAGIVIIMVFLWTGQVMDKEYAHLDGMEDFPRMAFRAGHIYILLSGLIHLCLGSYLTTSPSKWILVMQILGSLPLFSGSLLFIYSWFKELPPETVERSMPARVYG